MIHLRIFNFLCASENRIWIIRFGWFVKKRPIWLIRTDSVLVINEFLGNQTRALGMTALIYTPYTVHAIQHFRILTWWKEPALNILHIWRNNWLNGCFLKSCKCTWRRLEIAKTLKVCWRTRFDCSMYHKSLKILIFSDNQNTRWTSK